MKKIISLFLGFYLFSFSCSVFAQEYKSHIIAKGETVESIATNYNVSKSALFEANPALKNYIYAGMKIRIPLVVKNDVETPQVEKQNVEEASEQFYLSDSRLENTVSSSKTSPSNSVASSNTFIDEIRVGFLSSDAFSMLFSLGNNHFFDKSLYLGTQIGYGISSASTEVYGSTLSTTSHYIMLPIELGYYLWFSEERFTAIVPYAGADITYLAKATMKYEDEKETIEPDKRFDIMAKVGLKISFGVFFDFGYAFNDNGEYFYLGFGMSF